MTENRDAILALIKELTGQVNVLTIPRAFIDYMGDLDGALFLSQLLYWSDRAGAKGYFYKPYLEWERETTLGEYEVRKAVKKLKVKGLLTTKVQKANGSPTVHYKLNNARFSESFLEFLQKRSLRNYRNDPVESEETILEKLQEPLTEITTETTTEITTKKNTPTGEAGEVFVYWRDVHGHSNARLDEKRKKLIQARLKEYSTEELKLAIDGCKLSPFHQGRNTDNRKWDDIALICRDASHVDQFIAFAEGRANGDGTNPNPSRDARAVAMMKDRYAQFTEGPAPTSTRGSNSEVESRKRLSDGR